MVNNQLVQYYKQLHTQSSRWQTTLIDSVNFMSTLNSDPKLFMRKNIYLDYKISNLLPNLRAQYVQSPDKTVPPVVLVAPGEECSWLGWYDHIRLPSMISCVMN